MEVKSLSFSMITMFRQCPAKFARVYYHKDPRYLSEAAFEGSIVHDVLEIWMPDRTQDWTKILKNIMREKRNPNTDKLEYESMTHSQYVSAYNLLEEFSKRTDINTNAIQYEMPFDLILPNGVPISGRIDRIDLLENGTLNLVDYKTTRSYIYKNEVENSLQGSMYVLAAMYKLYPNNKYSFTIDALRFSPITVEFSSDFLYATMDYLENTYNEMQDMFKILDDNPDYVPEYKPNKYCGYCQYVSDCPAVKNITKTIYGEELFADLGDYARRSLDLAEQEKAIKKLRQSYENRIDTALVTEGVQHKNWGDCFAFYKELAYGPKLQIVDRRGGHVNESE